MYPHDPAARPGPLRRRASAPGRQQRTVLVAVAAALLVGPLPHADARGDHVDRTFGARSGWIETVFPGQPVLSGAPVRTSQGLVVPALTGGGFGQLALTAVRHHPDGRRDVRFGRRGTASVTVPGGVTAGTGLAPPSPADRLQGTASAPGRTAVAAGEGPSGSTVVGGVVWPVTAFVFLPARLVATRLHADGRVDVGYGDRGVATLPLGPVVLGATYTVSLGVHVLPDGAVLGVVWTLTLPPCGFGVPCPPPLSVVTTLRLRPDGRPDTSYGPLGLRTSPSPPGLWYTSSAPLADGSLLLGGSYYARGVVRRLTRTGTPDLDYGAAGLVLLDGAPDTFSSVAALEALPDGAAAVAVDASSLSVLDASAGRYLVHRLTPAGEIDATFGRQGTVSGSLRDTYVDDLATDGRLLVLALAHRPDREADDVVVVDARTGRPRWTALAPGPVGWGGEVLVDGRRVLISGNRLDADGGALVVRALRD